MKEKTKKVSLTTPNNRFAFYHQNEALLFQFLLHECLRAHLILKKKPDAALFLQLTGNLNRPSDTWQAPYGHLPRLFHYCSLLSVHFNNPATSLCKNLGLSLERAYELAKRCHDLRDKDEEEHAKHYTKLRKEIRVFMKLLFEKAHDFRDNASVLFFLLRHQEQLDSVYKEPIVRKTFHVFFPDGMDEAYHFLVEKLSKKGFNHLIPLIEQKLKNISAPFLKPNLEDT